MRRLALGLSGLTFLLLLLLATPVLATCGGGGGGGQGGFPHAPSASDDAWLNAQKVYTVPWKPVTDGQTPAGDLILYWFPNSVQEQSFSELLSSRQLTLAAGRCVALAVAPTGAGAGSGSGNTALRGKYKVSAAVSTVVLVTAADGAELDRVEGHSGRLVRLDEAESMVRDGLKRQEKGADDQLAAAEAREKAGDKEGAVTLYTQVAKQRCVAERSAKKAAKALKKLAAAVPDEASLGLPGADWSPATGKAIEKDLAAGLRAEHDLRIPDAEHAYQAAQRRDPGDPVPLRYLGELYRHHIGDWTRARAVFQQILAMSSDPLSRAVALHGLGKMTIHDGDFARGLAMFDQSIAAYPLALTYRNLAVYWSSEGDGGKAYGYVQQAMALDPDDEYNQIFAATYLVKLGRPDEAAKIASAHEANLAASYNLAAIWSLLGQRDKALALLKRHFYVYEQFDAVRRKEMHEAQVDIVFASLKADPAFRELTAPADADKPGAK
jgi:tetratricopeptide (TPR) repeat protein